MMWLIKLVLGLSLLGGGVFTGSVYYVDQLEKENEIENRQFEDLMTYVVNNNPSKIQVKSVKPLDTTKVDGLDKELPNFDGVKSDNNKIRIIYHNVLKERATGVKQPTNVIVIDKKDLEKLDKLKMTPKQKEAYKEAIRLGDYKTAYEIVEATKEK